MTALLLACQSGSESIARMLLERGANVHAVTNVGDAASQLLSKDSHPSTWPVRVAASLSCSCCLNEASQQPQSVTCVTGAWRVDEETQDGKTAMDVICLFASDKSSATNIKKLIREGVKGALDRAHSL